MTEITFASPPEPVQRARLAMARLEAHLAQVIDPMAPDFELTSVALAFMALEDVHPPYPPLPADLEPSADAAADLEAAIAAALMPAVDVEYTAAAMVGVGFEVGVRMVAHEPPDPEAAADFATRLFLGGLERLAE